MNSRHVPQQSAIPSLSTTLDTPTAAQHSPDTTASDSVPALACKHVTSRFLQLGQNFAHQCPQGSALTFSSSPACRT
ncbi:hypothetical protein MDA_GLEAN10000250 [Myotis davidii]|uniref:Uncharacterized protein n=1 Tax=Myotis davidii TaxID=225400 RepID=L5MHS5_MYODS|nr:hypothetical protein MDA_GLEAN10000250 [Myotis davidii]